MTGPEIATLLVVEIIAGAAGAIAVARLWHEIDLGWISSAVVGMLGGVILTLLAAQVPSVARFLGHIENAVDATSRGTGGLTLSVLVGVGIAGLLGGIISISLVGLARRASLPHL